MKIDAETLKKQVILHLPYVLFLLVFAKLGEAVRLAPGADASQKLLGLSEGFALAFQSMWPGAAMDWLIGLCGAAIMRLAVYLRGKDAKKYRKNVEYGSARWDAYYLLKEVFYGHRRRKHYDPIQQDYRAILPPFSR